MKYSQAQSEKAEGLVRQFDFLAGNRLNWESHWQEIAERVYPAHSKLFTSLGNKTQGEKRTEFIFDSTAPLALARFGSIMDSLLTPANQTWCKLRPSNRDLMKIREVVEWFELATEILFRQRYTPSANFSSQNQQTYLSLGAYGTGCLYVDELKAKGGGLRYRNVHLGEIYFKENHQGIVDAAFRKFPMTARQAIQKWGDACPDQIKNAIQSNPEREFDFLHVVEPREDVDPGRSDYKGMPYASYYIALEGKCLVAEGGYSSFPYAIPRYEQAPGETYGRSPGMAVLPAIKTLNEQKKTVLKQGHRVVDPVLLMADDGILDGFSLTPGAMNFGGVNSAGQALVHALPVGNIAIGKDMMDEERKIINDAFLVNIFQILTETPAMTATEVLERTREKGILLAPTVGRQQTEYLGPMIEREMDLLASQGLLPPMPQVLVEAKGEYRIEYDSPLSRAKRAEEASGIMRTVEYALNIVNVTQDHSPLDNFNWDVIVPEMADIQGVPARWMNSPAQIQRLRAGRAQNQQNQQVIQAAPAAAAMIKANAMAQKV